MTGCLDEGTLQAYFDGELDPRMDATVTAHLAGCPRCFHAADVLTNENQLLLDAFNLELAEPVPYKRLRHRVELAIAESETMSPSRASAPAGLFRNVSFTSGHGSLLYAGMALLIVLSTILGIAFLRRAMSPIAGVETPPPTAVATPEPAHEKVNLDPGAKQTSTGTGTIGPKAIVSRRLTPRNQIASRVSPDESKFVRQIAALAARIESEPLMRPALRVEYEHNVALLDGVIEVTRRAARNNPEDTQVTQFMFAAYQGKLDLLKQMVDAQRVKFQN